MVGMNINLNDVILMQMVLVGQLNENLTDCNENMMGLKENPSFIHMYSGTKQMARS